MKRLLLTMVFLVALAFSARARAQCGDHGQACCGSAPQCGGHLTCTVLRTCECGGHGQACCDGGHACGSNLTCAEGTCQCGGEGQACCEKTEPR